jgi:hypothetical protein
MMPAPGSGRAELVERLLAVEIGDLLFQLRNSNLIGSSA